MINQRFVNVGQLSSPSQLWIVQMLKHIPLNLAVEAACFAGEWVVVGYSIYIYSYLYMYRGRESGRDKSVKICCYHVNYAQLQQS